VVKLTTFLMPGVDIHLMREIRQRHFGEHRPASTAVYVPMLVSIDFLLEVEAVAVKSASAAAIPAVQPASRRAS
jgi:enamine deaminase RidA (YjgF/YER057c/UK114 family)